jgi:hypothetical protein
VVLRHRGNPFVTLATLAGTLFLYVNVRVFVQDTGAILEFQKRLKTFLFAPCRTPAGNRPRGSFRTGQPSSPTASTVRI